MVNYYTNILETIHTIYFIALVSLIRSIRNYSRNISTFLVKQKMTLSICHISSIQQFSRGKKNKLCTRECNQPVSASLVSRIPLDYRETASHTSHDEACVATHNWPSMRVFTHRTEKSEEGMIRGGKGGNGRVVCRKARVPHATQQNGYDSPGPGRCYSYLNASCLSLVAFAINKPCLKLQHDSPDRNHLLVYFFEINEKNLQRK